MDQVLERGDWLGAGWRPRETSRRACLVAVVLLHAAAGFAWWKLPRGAVPAIVPPRVTATIVAAQSPDRPPDIAPRAVPRTPPPKPRSAPPAPAAQASASAASFVPLPETPAPSIASPVSVSMDSVPVAVAAAAPSPAPAPPAAVGPRFDAAYLDNAPPAYPMLARQAREQGLVMLHVRVTPAGLPDTVEIRTSSGSTRLDEAARNAVLHWKFVPARQGDTPVTAWVLVPIRFALNG